MWEWTGSGIGITPVPHGSTSNRAIPLAKLPLANAGLNATMRCICLSVSVRSSVCCQKHVHKTRFPRKLSNLELWCLWLTNRKSRMDFSKNTFWNPYSVRWPWATANLAPYPAANPREKKTLPSCFMCICTFTFYLSKILIGYFYSSILSQYFEQVWKWSGTCRRSIQWSWVDPVTPNVDFNITT